ncbi:Bgt-51165 [Blumeria graminis f. sp. tritici]|uniref:Bgt-51165 n=1 Tax=Blumeria graminis f. sp. tritici TaxID=62690 RepID=A0A9X9MHL5_BLUGR|nr:Bgt-51165 [Blumeria graminis f. sp. tritici]
MAFKNDISVIGKYKSFAPTKIKNTISIEADKRFRLMQLVNDETIFTGKYWTTNSVALAWYQGHLHLFQWRGNLGWFPLTQIGEEQENGAMLYYFAPGNNHEIWNTHDDLPFKMHFFMRSLEWTEHEQRVIDQVVSQNADVQLNIEADKGKLHPTIHNGHIVVVMSYAEFTLRSDQEWMML